MLLFIILSKELRIIFKKLWFLFLMLIFIGIGRNLLSYVEWFIGMVYVGVLIGNFII